MMIRKAITAILLLSLAAGTTSAQQKRTTTKRVTVTHSHDDEDDNDHHVSDNRPGMIDSRSFYHTPYRSRNSGTYDDETRIISVGFGFPNTLYNDYGYLNYSYNGKK